MAPHSITLAWKIPWAVEPGRLQSTGSLRVGHGWATSLSLSLSCIGKGNGNPLQHSCLKNPRDGGAWLAFIYGIAQSPTRLKWLSSSSRQHIKKQRHYFVNKVHLVKVMVFPLVMYGCERWTIKKAECWRLDVVGEDSWESLGLQGDPTSPF